eukprot:sb/3464040/
MCREGETREINESLVIPHSLSLYPSLSFSLTISLSISHSLPLSIILSLSLSESLSPSPIHSSLLSGGETQIYPSSCNILIHDLTYDTYEKYIRGISSPSPHVKTTYLKVSDVNNVGFSATATATGSARIQRIDLSYGGFGVKATTKDDTFWLNKPEFIYSFEDGEYIYFIFKENASENQVEQEVTRIGMCGSPGSCDPIQDKQYGPFSQCPAVPSFKVAPANIEANYGETATFHCKAYNPDNTKLRWVKESGPLTHGQTQPDGALVLSSVTERDTGCYMCSLQGVSGVSIASACLVVLVSPKFTILPTDNQVVGGYGEDVLIPCRAEGSPAPQYRWDRLDGALPEGCKVTEQGDLKLVRVIEEDAGIYRCTAYNSIATIVRDITVKVAGSDPQTNPINKSKNYGTLMIIIIAVVVVCIVCVLTFCAVKVSKRNSHKKFQMVPGEPSSRLMSGYPTGSLARTQHTSLPSHNPSDIYHPNNWVPNTIAVPPRTTGAPVTVRRII